jgi:hypothetical protein
MFCGYGWQGGNHVWKDRAKLCWRTVRAIAKILIIKAKPLMSDVARGVRRVLTTKCPF